MPKSRAKRGCASKLACGRRIDPAEQSVFSVNPGEFVIFFWADRVVGPCKKVFDAPYSVGADDSVRPQTAPFFTEICSKFGVSQRADVGIGPYRVLCKFPPHLTFNTHTPYA